MTATTNAEIDESLFFLEQLARDHHNDGAPETALYINRAATMLRALRDQREADGQDAERYRFLMGCFYRSGNTLRISIVSDMENALFTDENLNEAIDAAIAMAAQEAKC